MARFTPPIPQDPIKESFVWRDWFQRLSDKVFGTLAQQDANNVSITGGAISNIDLVGNNISNAHITDSYIDSTPIGLSIPSVSHFTSTVLDTPLLVAYGGTGVATSTANYVFAGPTTGAAAAPAFRALVAADIPSLSGSYLPLTGGTLSGDLILSAGLSWTGGRVIYVPLSGDIQTYITAATAGDTLVLGSGTYTITAPLNIAKALTIVGGGSSATKITCSVAGNVLNITASSVRLLDFQIVATGASTSGIYVNDGCVAVQIKSMIIIMGGTGVKTGITSYGASVTVSNCEIYPTSSNANSNGILVANDSSSTINILVNIISCNIICTGVANNRCIVYFNNNSAKTISGTVDNIYAVAYAGGVSDYGLGVLSIVTTNVSLTVTRSIFNGQDFDILNTTGNTLTLENCVLINNTTSGPVTYAGTIVSRNEVLSGTLSVTGHTTFEGVTSTGATGTGKLVYDTSPVLVTPALGTPSSGTLTSCTGLPIGGIVATGTPSATTFLRGDSTWSVPVGAGDVVGPASAVASNVALFNGTTGKIIKDGGTLGTAAFTASTAYQAADTKLASIAALASAAGWLHNDGAGVFAYSTPTASNVGLGSVTNDAQTKASIVPNTVPSAGQLLAGNAGGSAYAAVSMSGDATIASTGAITVAKFGGTAFGTAAGHAATDFVTTSAPVTKTADFTVATTENWLINNKSGSTCVVTMPAAASFTGRQVTIKNLQAQLVNSVASNIVPIDSASAGTSILLGVVGNWATLVSDGTNWIIMQQAPNNILLLE